MELGVKIAGFVQAIISAVIITLIGRLFNLPFSGLQILIVVVVVLVVGNIYPLIFKSKVSK